MLRIFLKSKIQKASVTETNVEYSGSITIDSEILEASDILVNERVQVVNIENGARLETYVIPGEKGSGIIGMNGGAAKHAAVGDRLLIMSYILMETKTALAYTPKIIYLDGENKVIDKK